jgi:mitochondrial fission protein ELM1
MPLTAWAVTTGESGMRTQARGLAKAVAGQVTEKVVSGAALPFLRGPDDLTPLVGPFPDLVVSCGRRAAGRALAVRKASGGRTLAVHVQDPRTRPEAFDLVIAMDHDSIRAGPGVIKVATALHDIDQDALSAARAKWRPVLGALGAPLIGVIVGGDLKGRAFSLEDGRRLIDGLQRLRRETGAALAITPSRRTPEAFRETLAQTWVGDGGVQVWDMSGDNPYLGILALADRIVVTSDSVSMVSEALAAGPPVEVLDLGFKRHVGFIQRLVDARLIRRFEGDPAVPETRGPVNATLRAAEAVRALIAARSDHGRTGVVG